MDLEIAQTREFLKSLPTQSLLRNELSNRLDMFDTESISKDVSEIRRFIDSMSSPYVKQQINGQLDLIVKSMKTANMDSKVEKSIFDSVLASVESGEEKPRGI